LELVLSADGKISEFHTNVGVGSRMVLTRTPEETFRGELQQLPRFDREKVAVGVITSSFAAAAAQTGVRYEIIDDFVDLFSNRISFHQDFRVGDRFTIIYRDQVLQDGTSVQTGAILAAAVTIDGKQHVAIRYVGTDGKGRYFDANGELLGNAFLRYPLKFSRISSYFSTARFHPVLKRNRPHHGVDFAAPVGTPVRTVADGRVVFSGDKGPNGLMVKIQHSPRYSTTYLHLSKIERGVRRGARVQRGQVIGAVGATGLATGPHLHYGFYDNGRYVDPLKIKLPTIDDLGRGMRVEKRYLQKALFTLDHYQSVNLDNFGQGL
jgi:murein DD-endopeptidase MepM/ murein hydrolase activator NlpD